MSDQGPTSGSGGGAGGGGKPTDLASRKLNGHANGHAAPTPERKPGESVVVPFPKKTKPPPAWLGGLLGWIALLGFAGLVWGVSKDGRVDVLDVGAGLIGVFAALWFYRTR
jgi:hypothetical protein